jgi:hypothetical protein
VLRPEPLDAEIRRRWGVYDRADSSTLLHDCHPEGSPSCSPTHAKYTRTEELGRSAFAVLAAVHHFLEAFEDAGTGGLEEKRSVVFRL